MKQVLAFVFLGALATGAALEPPAGAKFQQPQLAADRNTVVMTFGAGNAIYFARSDNGGKTFSEPVKVAEQGVVSLGRHRGPRIVIAGNAIVISAVCGKKGKGADGDLIAWRSTDGGRTWSAGVRVNDRESAAREGLHGMAASSRGFVYAVWLDDRDGGKTLYGASSNDGGATWSPNHLIYASPDGHICECCHPSVAIGADGTVYAMFRNWLHGARDMYLAVSRDNGQSFDQPKKLGEGSWPLNACPMDGGGLSLGPNGVKTVWRRGDTIYTARPGAAEEMVGKGKDAAIAGDTVIWSAPDGLRIERGSKSTLLDPDGTFPSIVLANGRPVAAWESKTGIVTDRLE